MNVAEYLRELNKAAEVSIESSKPLKWYFRSTELVFKQACVYYAESDLEKAYVLFMKYSNLVLDQLPRHPEYNRPEHSETKLKLKKNCFKAVDLLERLRPVLEGNYLAAMQERKQAQAAAEEAERLRKRQEIQLAKLKEIQAKLERERLSHSINSSSSSNQPSLDESGHVAISSTVPAGIAQETTSAQVSSVDPVIQVGSEHSVAQTNSVPSSTESNSTSISTSTETSTLTETPPAHPTAIQAAPSIQDAPSIQPVATAPVQLKQKSRFFSESGRPLRPVHIPASIIDRFLAIAEENTRRNIETCGVIAGKLHQDEFTVTCLIIPKQSGTSDTCSMTNEEEIVEAQDNLDVMTLGWIHTHPTQSCFLSSVDLHTHMPFQMLMEEAIAIVCAPTKTPNFGIFRLTDPPGLDLINKCPHSAGSFHPHPDGLQIYRELKGPNVHAQMQQRLPLEVIDMRVK